MYLGTRIAIEGEREVYDEMLRLANAFPTAIDEIANRFMLALEGESKVQAPVDTGRLRDSIYSELEGFSGGSHVSTDTDYAIFPHINNPYMFRAFEVTTMRDLELIIDNVIDDLNL
jgi:hypothetical protein